MCKIHGAAYRDELLSSFSVHWDQQPFTRGGWALWPDRASLDGVPDARSKPVERLYFAGDHLSYVTAWQHGAFESARYVVTELHRRVLAGGD